MSTDDDYQFSSDILKLYLSTRIFWKSKGKGRERSTPSCKVRSQFFPSLPFSKVKMYVCKSDFFPASLFGRNPVGVLAAHGNPSFPTPANLSPLSAEKLQQKTP